MALFQGDVVEVKFFCQCRDQIGINVRHFEVYSISTPSLSEEKAAHMMSLDVSSQYASILGADASYRGLQLRKLKPTLGATFTATDGGGQSGSGGEVLPRQTCGIITLRTAEPGRAGRGRVYFPFPGESHTTIDGRPNPAYLADLNDLGDRFVNTWMLSEEELVINFKGVLYHRSAGTTTNLTGYQTRQKWATQRRRGDYGRPNALPF